MPTDNLFGLKDLEFKSTETRALPDGRMSYLMHFAYCGDIPETCSECDTKLYKHGTRHIEIVDTPFGGRPTSLDIEYPRRRCKDCRTIWQPTFDYIDEAHKMTKRALADITQHALRNTFADVSRDYPLSENTIKNVFVDAINEYQESLRFKTPAFLGLDELKINGEFIAVITDLEHRTMFDMLKKRTQPVLLDYFTRLPDTENIMWVCTDMFRPFERAIAQCMPNARWTIDHFHVVMKANECVDKIRKDIQRKMTDADRIYTKKITAYILKTRYTDLTPEQADAIRNLRNNPTLKPLAIAYDLKEDFFNIYDENPYSKDNAQEAFKNWESSIPDKPIYDCFRVLSRTVHHFYTQIFNYWDCPIAISNGFTECSNRLIRETNLRGRGYTFELLRARTLYRNTNMQNLIENNMIESNRLGPIIQANGSTFFTESDIKSDGEDGFLPNSVFDAETGELIE